MRRPLVIAASALAVPIIIVLVFMLASGREQVATGLSSGGDLTPVPEGSPAPDPVATMQARGLPTTRAVGASAITPPVTEEKVRAFVEQDPGLIKVIAKAANIDSIRFATVAEIKEHLKAANRHDPFGDSYPLDQRIVYVSLSGEFLFYDMDNVEHIYPWAYRVFDAETGNELMGGSGPWQPEQQPDTSYNSLTPIPLGNPAPDPIATMKAPDQLIMKW